MSPGRWSSPAVVGTLIISRSQPTANPLQPCGHVAKIQCHHSRARLHYITTSSPHPACGACLLAHTHLIAIVLQCLWSHPFPARERSAWLWYGCWTSAERIVNAPRLCVHKLLFFLCVCRSQVGAVQVARTPTTLTNRTLSRTRGGDLGLLWGQRNNISIKMIAKRARNWPLSLGWDGRVAVLLLRAAGARFGAVLSPALGLVYEDVKLTLSWWSVTSLCRCVVLLSSVCRNWFCDTTQATDQIRCRFGMA